MTGPRLCLQHHCSVEHTPDGRVFISATANGQTLVNGRPVSRKTELKHNKRVRCLACSARDGPGSEGGAPPPPKKNLVQMHAPFLPFYPVKAAPALFGPCERLPRHQPTPARHFLDVLTASGGGGGGGHVGGAIMRGIFQQVLKKVTPLRSPHPPPPPSSHTGG